MNYANRAAVIERLLRDLGDPRIVAVSLYETMTALQLDQPIEGIEWKHRTNEQGEYWDATLEREDVQIRLSAYKPRAVAA